MILYLSSRLSPLSSDDENIAQYSTEITIDGGQVRGNNAAGEALDTTGMPMVITFNVHGELNLFDYKGPAESDRSPAIYIQWTGPNIRAESFAIQLCLGQGKGVNPTTWEGTANASAKGELTACDEYAAITYSYQDGMLPLRFESIPIDDEGIVQALFSNGESLPLDPTWRARRYQR